MVFLKAKSSEDIMKWPRCHRNIERSCCVCPFGLRGFHMISKGRRLNEVVLRFLPEDSQTETDQVGNYLQEVATGRISQ